MSSLSFDVGCIRYLSCPPDIVKTMLHCQGQVLPKGCAGSHHKTNGTGASTQAIFIFHWASVCTGGMQPPPWGLQYPALQGTIHLLKGQRHVTKCKHLWPGDTACPMSRTSWSTHIPHISWGWSSLSGLIQELLRQDCSWHEGGRESHKKRPTRNYLGHDYQKLSWTQTPVAQAYHLPFPIFVSYIPGCLQSHSLTQCYLPLVEKPPCHLNC